MEEVLNDLKEENLAIVFTFCDESKKFDIERALKYINELFTNLKDVSLPIPDKN